MGLGGAYAALGEGIQGSYSNAAAPSVREPFSLKAFDWDASVGLQLPGAFAGIDFENRGNRGTGRPTASRFSDFVTINVGLQVQLGPVGASLTNDLQLITLAPASAVSPGLLMTVARINGLLAVALARGQLLLGGGVRAIGIDLAEDRAQASAKGLIAMTGAAPQLGVLLHPNGFPWRAGVTFRTPVSVTSRPTGATTTDPAGVARIGSFVLPDRVELPWEIEGGFALQLGPRPLNPEWIDPTEQESEARRAFEANVVRDPEGARAAFAEERKRLRAIRSARYANWPREKILLSASVVVTGPGSKSVSVESFLEQRLDPFGRTATVSPRVGIEGEPIVDWVRARAGSYLEPSRYQDGAPRQHFTFGGDFRLFYFSPFGLFDGAPWWSLTLGLDIAPRYTNWGVSIGPWR